MKFQKPSGHLQINAEVSMLLQVFFGRIMKCLLENVKNSSSDSTCIFLHASRRVGTGKSRTSSWYR